MTRIPKHIGIIPDGNRRWALENGLEKRTATATGFPPVWNCSISADIWE